MWYTGAMRTRQFIASVLAGLVLILGGVGLTAAPAQGAGSYVEFNQGSGGHGYVTIYRTTGVYTLSEGSWATGVWKVCPVGYERIKWVSSSGASGLKNNAECLFPSASYSYGVGTRAP